MLTSFALAPLANRLGEKWKGMNANARAPFDAKAAADKKRFKSETEAYDDLTRQALAMPDSRDDSDEAPAASRRWSDSRDELPKPSKRRKPKPKASGKPVLPLEEEMGDESSSSDMF